MGKIVEVEHARPIKSYLAEPAGEPKGAIIVIHEVWGLTDHIKSVADRLAAEGYIALAPDLLSGTGVEPEKLAPMQNDLFNPEKRNEVQPELRRLMAPIQQPDFGPKTTEALLACFNYLYDLPAARQKVSVIGFCFGGTYSFSLAVAEPRLKIALPFYGHAEQPADELKSIACPIHAFYGEKDERLIGQLPDLTERMAQAGVDFHSKVYPDCGHAFFNDTNPYAYNQAAAEDAWNKVLDLLAAA